VAFCQILPQTDCTTYGGVYMGNGTLCEPNPCVSGVDDASQITALSLTTTPNPSTGQVMIRYTLPKATAVTIEVFNTAGTLLMRMDEGARPAGQHAVAWGGRNEDGNKLPSGIYLARIVTGEGTTTGRVVLAR
jgi:flagellar hook assembly protein FlgD